MKIKFLLFSILPIQLFASAITDQTNEPNSQFFLNKTEIEIDLELKKKQAKDLVLKAIEFTKSHSFDKCMEQFRTQEFIKGDTYIAVGDMNGRIITHGNNNEIIWKDFYNVQDAEGNYFIRDAINTAELGGGWITYEWFNVTKKSYVQKFEKNGDSYFILAGYYPHSKKDAVITLVTQGVKYFNANGKTKTQNLISYPLGRFVEGDLFLFLLDFNGVCWGNGKSIGLIGKNLINEKDSNNKLYIQEFIQSLKVNKFDWISYSINEDPKEAFLVKITDAQTKQDYILGCEYSPDIKSDVVKNLVKKGIQFFKTHGPIEASKNFSKEESDYSHGYVTLFVFDFNGKCIAHGEEPSFVGKDMLDIKDQSGEKFVEKIIKKAKENGGWLSYRWKNANYFTYIEKITLSNKNYAIGAGFFPISKYETSQLLINSAVDAINQNGSIAALRDFTKDEGLFIRGDLFIFAYDLKGNCLAYRNEFSKIWQNFLEAKDDNGKNYVKEMIEEATSGYGWTDYSINNSPQRAFVKLIQPSTKKIKYDLDLDFPFIIGTVFYK
ncbi:MAG: hypothetical protein UR26_C0001G0024 [candidate division TM6 bacterium GW2011_GWF2_32_72]|nr:MAG: hypothetical protein UR26_C0001G0024 [candidate division TM6 bacterium GW2011_GWF2_32_72]